VKKETFAKTESEIHHSEEIRDRLQGMESHVREAAARQASAARRRRNPNLDINTNTEMEEPRPRLKKNGCS